MPAIEKNWSRWRRLVLFMAALVLLAPIARGDQSYIVRRNDTLSGIARRYGVPITTLAERNGITKGAHVYVGQQLIVPLKSPAPRTTAPATRDSIQQTIETAP